MVWKRHIENDIKSSRKSCYQISSKSIKLINVFILKTYINVMLLYVSMLMIYLFWTIMIAWSSVLGKIWTYKIVIKDLGVIDIILRTKITKILNELILYQFHFVETVLNKFCIGNNSNIKTPLDMNARRI